MDTKQVWTVDIIDTGEHFPRWAAYAKEGISTAVGEDFSMCLIGVYFTKSSAIRAARKYIKGAKNVRKLDERYTVEV